MPRSRFVSRSLLCTFVAISLTLAGCDPANMGAFRGVAQKVGAKVVSRSSDEEIRKMFEKTNSQCPIKMDAFTTLENVTMIDDTNIEFHYKVNDKGRELVKGISKGKMRDNAVKHMKGNAMAVAVAERDLSIQHIYEDKRGMHILSYTINKAVLNGEMAVGSETANPFAVNTVKANSETVVTTMDDSPGEGSVSPEEGSVEDFFEELEWDDENESEEVPDYTLPQRYKPERRSTANPAGVQTNPFFN